jgi:hypothetical protein
MNYKIRIDDGYAKHLYTIDISNKLSKNNIYQLIQFYFKILNPFVEIWYKIYHKYRTYKFIKYLENK